MFDLVLWGASGFTGRLTANYLAKHAGDTKWAIAGRNKAKLEGLGFDVPILVGDSHDETSLDAIVKQTKVLCTTVGPYTKYGTPLVAACAKAGINYCDLTGETNWMMGTVRQFHDAAKASGARIVHTCGFDSIPSDLGVLMMHEHAAANGEALAEVRYYVDHMSGAVSGGTVASMLSVAERLNDKDVRRALADPYALNPEGAHRGTDGRDLFGARYDAEADRWTGPFIMAGVNTRVVRRSNALADFKYGKDFRYSEVTNTGRGAKGWFRATTLATGLGAFAGAIAIAPTRWLLKNTVLPKPGQGPNKAQREAGSFQITLRAKTQSGGEFKGKVTGEQDPGYGETAKMLSQSALCLAHDELPSGGGVLTPATAMGTTLIERLKKAGMGFEISAT